MLIAMAGLPGAGKSRLADDLGRARGWPVLSVDPIEAAIVSVGFDRNERTGLAAYVAVEAVAEHLLGLGQSVIVDAVNDVPEARQQWIDLAARSGVDLRWIEVTCSDAEVHQSRLSGRRRNLAIRLEPRWEELAPRRARLAAWTAERVRIDSLHDPDTNLQWLIADLVGREAASSEPAN